MIVLTDLQTQQFYAFVYGLLLSLFLIFVKLVFFSPVERKSV